MRICVTGHRPNKLYGYNLSDPRWQRLKEQFKQILKENNCEETGIDLIETEEVYTSGTSFLDDELPIKENYNKSRRVHRGLFKSNNGEYINADVNGAFQIMRKVFLNVKANEIVGAYSHPVIINL